MPDADFREYQEEAIQHIVDGRDRLLLVQRTGWGKSNVYFIAAKLMREEGSGPALLISPLLALMRNQIAAAERMGVRAHTIHSDNKENWETVKLAVRRNEVDVLLISPERLANQEFIDNVLGPLSGSISLLIVDEAHCISDWGHDFRPHYRLIERVLRTLPPNLRVLATTATANNRVMKDLEDVLGPNLVVQRGDLCRPTLALQTVRLETQALRMAWLARHLPTFEGSGIVYCLTKRDSEKVARWLQSRGINAEPYHAGIEGNRKELEDALLENRVKALVSTSALGMGFDKPDLAFVVHYQSPGSVIAYYQQVGRAGRAIPRALGVLLSGTEDAEINEYFIESAFPSKREVAGILAALGSAAGGLSILGLTKLINMRHKRLEYVLKVLSLESPSPLALEAGLWHRTPVNVDPKFWDRVDRLTNLRRLELAQMEEYVSLTSGHLEFLMDALDSPPSGCCGQPLEFVRQRDADLVRAAHAFIQDEHHYISPRKQWPFGGLPRYGVKGNIKPECLAQEGRSLSEYNDGGWGGIVKRGKYEEGRLPDELVDACVELLSRWNPQPTPTWICCVPSLRHPELVPDFSRRLAARLGLPLHVVISKVDDRPPQKEMQNNAQQAGNLDGALTLNTGKLPSGPVLLIDDVVDSRWTMTVAAWLLREHGSGEVFPLALAQAWNSQ